MDSMQFDHLKGAVEALLFVSEKPVTVEQLKDAIAGAHMPDLKEVLVALKKDYDGLNRGMVVVEIANGWQMLSSANQAGYIREFYKTRHKEKLSRPSLETLAIIAYKQPVSRTDVEVIRGVNSDGVVMHLLNKGLIKIVGRKEVPGRPYVYGTTVQFLEYFGLRSLEDLPKLEDFAALAAKENEVPATPNESAGIVQMDAVFSSAPEGIAATSAEGQAPAAAEAAQPTLEEVHQELEEELARARTRLDIEELERRTEKDPNFVERDVPGESSGQSRTMGEGDGVSDGESASEREA